MVVRYSCVLCGIGISSSPSSDSEDWLREYRAVYRKGAHTFVSGVAQYHDDPSWIVPVKPNLRWDTVLNPEGLLEISVMGQPAVDGSHGFVLHDACWCLLQKAGGATALSKNRLDSFRGSDLKLAPNGRFPASHASKDDASNLNAPLEPRGRGDCFSRLPWELREMILIHLETKDALNLRQSSWSFKSLLSSLGFWRSRFEPDGERGFIFEARDEAVAHSIGALQSLYRSSTTHASSPPLMNRQRVWKLARQLLPLIRPPVMASSTSDTLLDTGGLEGWISLPSILYSVAALHGFNVALGPHGVRALQIVGPQRDACSWIGRTEGVPISELLGVKKSVNRLRVTCDGYKITALSVYCDKTESTTSCEPEDTNLRHTAVWYPKVPPEDLVLNDGSFTGLRPVSTTYQPISWIKFGGQRGKNLPHVKGVMIKFDNASLSGLQFVYDCDVPETGNAASESFGRCGPSKMEGALLFSIDGAAGERITSISVGLAVYENPDYPEHLRHGIIQYLTMSTNFDRTTSLGKKKDGFRMKNVDVASGTTITGFYGHFAWGDGLINLGVISEYL
ncbi:hypothetical protein HC256_010688 [Beauveria bassiana]|nr:hypothetical protein HC256_010688 [Beauveria bassiana]